MRFTELKKLLISFVYPNRCPVCDREIHYNDFFCAECGGAISEPPCEVNTKTLASLTAATTYDEISEKVVFRLKNATDLNTVHAVAFLINERLRSEQVIDKVDLITAVPIYRRDFNRRGYNQSALVAKQLARLSGKPFAETLKKDIETAPQKSLSAAERMLNLTGAFSAFQNANVKGKNVLLVDDVSTTGSTLRECASQLVIAGADNVFGAVFAKTRPLT